MKQESLRLSKFFMILLTSSMGIAVTFPSFSLDRLVCVIPQSEKKSEVILDKFIALKEPQTTVKFDSRGNLESIQSPNCNKFESTSVWSHKIKIICGSNLGQKITISINTKNLTFLKQKSNGLTNISTYSGFCRNSKKN